MPINILMPALSPTMEEGTLAKWLVKEGDTVASGAILAEIETDKATMEFEAVDEGIVGKIVVPEGTEGVKVNDLIAVLLEEGESADAIGAAPAKPAAAAPAAAGTEPAPAAAPAAAAPVAAPACGKQGGPVLRVATRPPDRGGEGPRPRGDSRAPDPTAASSRPTSKRPSRGRRRSQPLAAAAKAAPQSPAATAPAGPDAEAVKKMYADREFEEIKLDGMRKIIAARLTEAKQTIPHFYLRREIRLDALLAFRSQLNKELEARGREAVGERLHHQGLRPRAAAGAGLQCGLGRRSRPQAEAVRRRRGGRDRGRALHAGPSRCRQEVALGAFGRDEGPRRARAQPQARPARVSGRQLCDLEPRHDGDRELRRGHQSAARLDPGGRRGRAEAGRRRRRARSRSRR